MSFSTPRLDRLDKNFLINGGLDYWQRNNNLSSGSEISGYNSVDRFTIQTFNTSGTRQSARQGGDKPNELSKYSALLAFTSTASASFDISQKIEGILARQLSGQTCSFGMWYKTDEFNSVRIRILRPTAEDNYASTVTIYDQTIAVTADSTWRQLKLEGLITMDSSMYLGCQVLISGVGRVNSSGSRFFRYAQLQLCVGSQLPTFCIASRDLFEELLLCQRYFEKSYDLSVNVGQTSTQGRRNNFTSAAGDMRESVRFTVRKRAVPVGQSYSNVTGAAGQIRDSNAAADRAASVVEAYEGAMTIAAGGITASGVALYEYTADAEI